VKLSAYLQSNEIVSSIKTNDLESLRKAIVEKGERWFALHPENEALIKHNLAQFGLKSNADLIQRIKQQILLHYYEKLIGLCCDPDYFSAYLKKSISADETLKLLKDFQKQEKPVLLATPHFGGVELISPFLSASGFPVTATLRFTTEQFGSQARLHAQKLFKSGRFAKIDFIEIGHPKTIAALEMAAVFRRKGMLFSVFDEKTNYSAKVNLLGKSVWGGAGLDKLISFANVPLAVMVVCMVRTKQEQYRLIFKEIPTDGKSAVQKMYDFLETNLEENIEQWYFLHEEIPFVK
jgi:lauroyl/myristoyl acyltransferase